MNKGDKLGLYLYHFDSRMFHKAVEFFSTSLEIDNDDIPIKIDIVDNIGRGRTAGTCAPDFDEDFKIKKIDIQIKYSTTTIGMIEALAHEMVHAKQWIKGELSVEVSKYRLFGILPVRKFKKLWNGKDISSLSYYEQPPEKEAHFMQRYMVHLFLDCAKEKIYPTTMAVLLDETDSIIN